MGTPRRELPVLAEGDIVKRRWVVEKMLGKGGFGAVYLVRDLEATGNDGPVRFAMKTEDRSAKATILKMEIAVLKRLNEARAVHACRLVGRGQTEQMNYLVMTLTSESLHAIVRKRPGKILSMSTGLRVGIQGVEALKELHNVGFLHRDVKPANFAVGRRDARQERLVFLLDFGLAREYRTSDGLLRTPREQTGFRGTLRYAPIASHTKEELSRKDDMESWLYMTVETVGGPLPWANLADKNLVGRSKDQSRRNKSLLARVPIEFHRILRHLDTLHFVDEPDYGLIIDTLNAAAERLNLHLQQPFDWERMDDVP